MRKLRLPRFVYAIQHNVTKKIYVGSSCNPDSRYMSHIYSLRNNSHHVGDMQSDFNKYGENFSFFVLDMIANWSDRNKEYEWMRRLRTYDRQYGYNYKDHAKCQIYGASIPYSNGLPKRAFQDSKKGLREHEMRNELIDYINSLTPEQVEKLYSRLAEIEAEVHKKEGA